MVQCHAHAKSTGKQCTRHAMPNGCCYVHGGPTPSGIAASRYKHGRYSSVLPTHLLERYERSATDPDYLSGQHDIALIDTRIGDLLQQSAHTDNPYTYERILAALADYDRLCLMDAANAANAAHTIAAIRLLVAQGCGDAQVWRDITTALEQR